MKCPACENELHEITADTVKVDACTEGCGGIWFDLFELKKMDEPDEMAGEKLLDLKQKEGVEILHKHKRRCPKCRDITMIQHFFSVKHEVTVDECPKCGGFFLDAGELRKIRQQFASEEDRRKAAKEYFNQIFGQELDYLKKKSREKEKKARKIARMFRFITPSYYIPGDQDWGAY